jgi:hypothetical protein
VRRRGRPVRGFFAGLLLGLFLSFDLALMGAVKLESAVLTILPAGLAVLGLILGWWAPLGRPAKPHPAPIAPLPAPVAWPESAPVEGSTAPPAQAVPDATPPPPVAPPSV